MQSGHGNDAAIGGIIGLEQHLIAMLDQSRPSRFRTPGAALALGKIDRIEFCRIRLTYQYLPQSEGRIPGNPGGRRLGSIAGGQPGGLGVVPDGGTIEDPGIMSCQLEAGPGEIGGLRMICQEFLNQRRPIDERIATVTRKTGLAIAGGGQIIDREEFLRLRFGDGHFTEKDQLGRLERSLAG